MPYITPTHLSLLRPCSPIIRIVTNPSTRRWVSADTSSSRDYNASKSAGHTGKDTDQHVTNSKDELDVHSAASRAGQRARQAGDPAHSSATSERDSGNNNRKAAEDSKAPQGTVIGMNDERGGVRVDASQRWYPGRTLADSIIEGHDPVGRCYQHLRPVKSIRCIEPMSEMVQIVFKDDVYAQGMVSPQAIEQSNGPNPNALLQSCGDL